MSDYTFPKTLEKDRYHLQELDLLQLCKYLLIYSCSHEKTL